MKKARLSVYLDPEMMAQLAELADQKQQPKSLIAEAAIMSFLTPDDADRREAALARRLDLLTRQGERLERDLWVAAETLALFIRFWLTVTTPLPENAQAAAQAKGRERFDSFLQTVGRRLAKGKSVLRELSFDGLSNGIARSENGGKHAIEFQRGPAMKRKISGRLSEEIVERLETAAHRPGASKTTILEAALDRFLDPGAETIDDATLLRRLDGMSRQLEQLEHDLKIVNEAVALHARYHLAITPPLPQSQQRAACALGLEGPWRKPFGRPHKPWDC